MKGKIYLIPTPISDDEGAINTIPAYNMQILSGLDYFIVENIRTARRFISRCKLGMVIDSLTFNEFSEHSTRELAHELLKPVLAGKSCGIMSEAGLPAVADPGSEVVAAAHRLGVEVIPLVGPSSLMLALMASGCNGQQFAFNGYLPIKPGEREKKIANLVMLVSKFNQTQIFIEAPYRNVQLFEALLKTVPSNMTLTVASNITSESEYIKSYPISEWRKQKIESMLRKIPVIFVLGNC